MNVEQDEARAAMDKLAAEIHGVYIEHAKRIGIEAPRWDKMGDNEKTICRDIARLVLGKMTEAYLSGQSKPPPPPKVDIPITMPKTWTAEDAKSVVKEIAIRVAESIDRFFKAKEVSSNLEERQPVIEGIDDAVFAVSKECALEAFKENPELRSKLNERVVDGLMSAFFPSEGGEPKEE